MAPDRFRLEYWQAGGFCCGRDREGGRPHEEYTRFGHVGNLLHEIDGIHIHLDLQTVMSGPLQEPQGEEKEGMALLSPEEELPAVAAPDPRERGFSGSDHI